MSYLPIIESHLRAVTSAVVDADQPMWPSVVDVRTGQCPAGEHVPQRVYRLIGAPRGSTLYWDQPLIVAAHAVSDLTGRPEFATAADVYTRSFLDQCVAPTGMFRWGNHIYYDVYDCRVVEFHGGPHELRPITPAWESFWRLAPKRTAAYIRAMGRGHVYDPVSGGFNRHDDGKRGHAFLEAGGILSESLAWLAGKTGDGEALDLSLRIAGYSYRHRDPVTGLVMNEPDHGRWDSEVCTTEVGLWAQCLLRAGRHTGEDAFIHMARDATRAYLEYAYDSRAGTYAGQVAVSSGRPVTRAQMGYWPRAHADPWGVDQWPNHDYPMALAEACLSLHEATGDSVFLDAVQRWARLASENSPGRTGRWAYAESYGRCLHFLARAGCRTGDELLMAAALALAEEAVGKLYENGVFQGYPGSHVYESVDGVGYLLLGLILLETQQEPDLLGFGF